MFINPGGLLLDAFLSAYEALSTCIYRTVTRLHTSVDLTSIGHQLQQNLPNLSPQGD